MVTQQYNLHYSSCSLLFYFRLKYDRACSLWTLMDPLLMNIMWTPLFTILIIIILSVYFKVAYLAYHAKRKIQNQQVNSQSGHAAHSGTNRSQSKTTKSLLMVLGIFTSTYTIWLIIYYITVDTYSDTIELVQTLIEWLWQVGSIL